MKHFVIYFENATQGTTTPREWARKNQVHFPNYDFSCNDTRSTPNTETVARYLLKKGFKLIQFEGNKLYIKI